MKPTHDPTQSPQGANPYIVIDGDETWNWDFIKKLWFQEEDVSIPEPLQIPLSSLGKRVFIDEESQPPPKKAIVPPPDIIFKPSTIYIQNLPIDTQMEEMIPFFSKTGIIKRDEFTGQYKVKLYRNEDGSLKGDALVTYFQPESVLLSVQILDGSDFRYKHPIQVSEAEFNPQKGNKKKNKKPNTRKRKIPIRYDQKKDLSWEEETRVYVVIKGMFRPEETWTDLEFAKELKEDVKVECEKFGPVDLVAVFENNPEGVVTVKFQEAEGAATCIEVMDGRFFAGRQLSAEYYDGFTNYKVEESEETKKRREAAWEAFIGAGEESDSEPEVE